MEMLLLGPCWTHAAVVNAPRGRKRAGRADTSEDDVTERLMLVEREVLRKNRTRKNYYIIFFLKKRKENINLYLQNKSWSPTRAR